MEIADSARKHGVSDDDMLHAVRNPIRVVPQRLTHTLFIGPAFNGAMLEVVVLDDDEEEPVVIHAMLLRPKFHHQL